MISTIISLLPGTLISNGKKQKEEKNDGKKKEVQCEGGKGGKYEVQLCVS